jgi:outer membrane protein assembly factor BamB
MMRVLILLLLGFLVSGCGSLFSSDTEEEPAELVDIEQPLEIETLWSTDVGSGTEEQRVNLVPTIAGNRIFAADREGQIEALDRLTGELVWEAELELPVAGGPGVGNGLVLVGTSDGEVVALNEEDGTEKWRARVSSEVLSVPKAALGVAVVQTIDGQVFGLDAETGTELWVYRREMPVLSLRGSSSPVIYESQVISGFANGKLVSVDLNSGQLIWEATVAAPSGRSELERIVDIEGDPIIVDGVVYVVTFQGQLAAFSATTGITLWERPFSSHAGLGADWRQIYVTDDQDNVWALDQTNGASLWKQDKLTGRRLTAPAALRDYVLIGDFEGYIHWLSVDNGRIVGRVDVGGDGFSTPPVVRDGTAYVYTNDGELSALSLPLPPAE